MNLEIEKMNEEIIELREDNQRLQKMCSIVEQMNVMLNEVINECKCFSSQTFDTKTKTKLNILNEKYIQLKDIENNFSLTTDRPKCVTTVSTQTTSQSLIKKSSSDESVNNFESMDQMLTSNEVNVITLNDKQNQLLTIGSINDSFFKDNEELNIELILPQIVYHKNCGKNEDQNQELIESKTFENKTKINKKINKRLNKTKDDLKRFKTNNKLKRRIKEVSCDWPGCQMRFRDTYNLSVHRIRHTGEKSFVCCIPGCHKSYATKAALDVHRNSHSDNRRFKCTYSECGAAFIRKTQLNVHISQCHTHDFPYKCNWPGCEYQGCYLNRLNSHRLSHTGHKPFKCEWNGCDASFRLNHHLKAHMLKHTGEKPVSCQLSSCDKRFQSKQAMKIHFEKIHFNH